MENASKALLIAGSLLIVILLIAMGVKTFNSTQGTTESVETTMNATEIAIFNSKFTSYLGNNKSKNDVISLVNQIIASNSNTNTNNREVIISINIGNTSKTIGGNSTMMNAANNLSNTNKYEISINSYYTDGKIHIINIKQI